MFCFVEQNPSRLSRAHPHAPHPVRCVRGRENCKNSLFKNEMARNIVHSGVTRMMQQQQQQQQQITTITSGPLWPLERLFCACGFCLKSKHPLRALLFKISKKQQQREHTRRILQQTLTALALQFQERSVARQVPRVRAVAVQRNGDRPRRRRFLLEERVLPRVHAAAGSPLGGRRRQLAVVVVRLERIGDDLNRDPTRFRCSSSCCRRSGGGG